MAKTGFGNVFLDVACSLLLKKCSELHRKRKIKNITQVVATTAHLNCLLMSKKAGIKPEKILRNGKYTASSKIH